MPAPDFIDVFVKPLEEAGFRYMISGSVAATLYGEPRATLDVDIAVFLGVSDLASFSEAFPEEHFDRPPNEVLVQEIRRANRGHFNLIHHGTGAKADFYPSRDHPYLGWALRNVRTFEASGQVLRLAPPEYVVLWKLEFFREGREQKHLRDIRGILDVQGDSLDRKLLDEAVRELGLDKEWERARDES